MSDWERAFVDDLQMSIGEDELTPNQRHKLVQIHDRIQKKLSGSLG